MNYSYVMGVKNIDELRNNNFHIEEIDGDYGVSFNDDKRDFYEDFINRNLENGFWNEYLGKEKVFIFKFEDGSIKRYVIDSNNENEVLNLCRKFANANFESMDSMLRDNIFYLKNYFESTN